MVCYAYYELTKYNKIIDAINNNTLDSLNKNLKVIAKNIVIQNGCDYTKLPFTKMAFTKLSFSSNF